MEREGTTLQAGASVVTITPPLGTPIVGLFHERFAETIEDDLTVRALVLDDGATRLALVVCDLISLKLETVTVARKRIAARCNIPDDHVMIASTHTHTGPSTSDRLGVKADRAYLDWVATRIADGVAVACSRLVPARVASGAAEVQGVCFNRRFRMKDGTVRFNPGIGNPDIVGPAGPVDPRIPTLLVEDMRGEPLALWASLSTHYVGTDNELALSPDYYGDFARAVARSLGPQCIGLLANGTSGNVNNVDVHQAVKPRGSARARLVGDAVAAAAISGVLMRQRHDDPLLAAETFPFTVARRRITEEDVALAEAILAQPVEVEPDPVAGFSFVVGQPIPGPLARRYSSGVLELARRPTEGTTEVQVMRVGDFAIVALPGEIFVEFGLHVKAEAPFDQIAVVGLANDHIGYVATREAYQQGGYETWPNTTTWSAPGTGEAMIEAVLARLRDLRHRTAASAA